ncbi:hypothetical protein [Nocardioides plantarum]|uniref:hypothetical protein n=1 Tax=Nocardioides plantarum TaxID=29299 RepID=UPI003608BFCA
MRTEVRSAVSSCRLSPGISVQRSETGWAASGTVMTCCSVNWAFSPLAPLPARVKRASARTTPPCTRPQRLVIEGAAATRLSIVPLAVTSCEPGTTLTVRTAGQSASPVSEHDARVTPLSAEAATTEVRDCVRTSARVRLPFLMSMLVIVLSLIWLPVISGAAVAEPTTDSRTTAAARTRAGRRRTLRFMTFLRGRGCSGAARCLQRRTGWGAGA